MNNLEKGISMLRALDGMRFIKNTIVRKASTQYLRGRITSNNKVRLVSTIWQCFLSVTPFVQGCLGKRIDVEFHIVSNVFQIPWMWIHLHYHFETFYFPLKFKKIFKEIRFFFKWKIHVYRVQLSIITRQYLNFWQDKIGAGPHK